MKPGKIIASLIILLLWSGIIFSQSRIYVDIDASGSGDGSSWSNAYNDPQDAIDVASAGDSIWVAEGIYMPSRDISGNPNPPDPRTKSFYIDVDLKIFGGFDGTETIFAERDIKNNLCVFSGNIGDEMINGDNSYHVVVIRGTFTNPISLACEIDGFSIEDGNADITDFTNLDSGGGGIIVRGGGVNNRSSPTISNCRFRNNYGYTGGGAIRAEGTSNGNSEPNIFNCIFENNSSNERGAAIDAYSYFGLDSYSNVNIANCLFYDNQSVLGSVISASGHFGTAIVKITNATIADNSCAALEGSHTISNGSATLSFDNSIAFGNTTFSDLSTYTYSETTSLRNADPLFVDRAAKNFRLRPCSPAIDAGTDALNNLNTDVEGGLRIQGSGIDIGAYETVPQGGPKNVVYVSTLFNECQDGSSWATAYNDLQMAINVLATNEEIWLAEGIYIPSQDTFGNTAPTDPRTKTFYINKDVKIYGGFSGTETMLSERDLIGNRAILSGVIGNSGVEADSVYHVVYVKGGSGNNKVTSACELEGLVITGGRANMTVETLRQDRGAGLYLDGEGLGNECSPAIRYCTFKGNHSYLGGGGLLASGIFGGLSKPIIYNSTFDENYSTVTGSAIWADGRAGEAKATIYNSRFYKNAGVDGGFRGAIAARPDAGIADLHLINCTLASNSPAAILSYAFPGQSHELRIENSIFWDNGVDITDLPTDGVTYIESNNLMGIDPQFSDLTSGILELTMCSPAVGFGNNALNTTEFDLLGNPRIQSVSIDAGAYESPFSSLVSGSIIYVNQNATPCAENGLSWEDAFTTLQPALDIAEKGDTIWVAAGTYLPTADSTGNGNPTDPRDLTFFIDKDIVLLGGFNGTETTPAERDHKANTVTLTGDIGTMGTDTDNAYHVLTILGGSGPNIISNDFVIDGFTITKGQADATAETNLKDRGAGIYLKGRGNSNEVSPTIRNCTFIDNHSYLGGGGLLADGSESGRSMPLIFNCNFESNFSSITGSALWADGRNGISGSEVYNSRFYNNSGDDGIFRAAIAGRPDFGFVDIDLINCTIVSNFPAGILAYDNDGPAVFNLDIGNSIFWNNNNQDITQYSPYNLSIESSSFCKDPEFVDLAGGDLRLQPDSPAANRGDNSLNTTMVDLDGNPRIVSQVIDMGAYESNNTYIPQTRIYVDASASGCSTGESWTDAFTTLQAAIDQAEIGDTLWVADGIYAPTLDVLGNETDLFLSFTRTFSFKKNIKVFGGFSGNETEFSQRDFQTNKSILSGLVPGPFGSISNVFHLVTMRGGTLDDAIDEQFELDGFTLRDGNAPSAGGVQLGGALWITADGAGSKASPKLTNLTFVNNSSFAGGASAFVESKNGGEANPIFKNCIIENNISQSGGTAIHVFSDMNSQSAVQIINSRIYNNSGPSSAAFVCDGPVGSAELTLTNCTVVASGSTGIRAVNGAAAIIENSIIFNHGVDTSSVNGGSFSIISSTVGTDPQFFDLASGDLTLLPCSPAVNGGDNSLNVCTLDLNGIPRILESIIDQGCYENVAGSPGILGKIIYVDEEALGCRTGSTWENAFRDLQDAINVAVDTNEIWVAAGTYKPTQNRLGGGNMDPRNRTFYINKNIKLYGGFVGDETNLTERDPANNTTILNGDLENIDGRQAYNVVYIDGRFEVNGISNEMILDGFTIRGGSADQAFGPRNGAGIHIDGSFSEAKPLVVNCIVESNFSNNYGGAVYCDGSNGEASPVFKRCIFRNNSSKFGGAIFNDASFGISSPIFVNCLFTGNSSPSGLGGNQGGAIYNFANEGVAKPRITNCTFFDNRASQGGVIYNTVFSGIEQGEGMPVVNNSILYNNQTEILNVGGSTLELNNSMLNQMTTGVSGEHNILGHVNPEFIGSGDFRLQATSPAINGGENGFSSESVDLGGANRIQNNFIDMGAYENQDECNGIVPNVIYVDAAATGANNGSCWRDAYNELNVAITAGAGKQVWVAKGTYTDAENTITMLRMFPGTSLYGSFIGGEVRIDQRSFASSDSDYTIVDGSNGANAPQNFVLLTTGQPGAYIVDGIKFTGANRGMALTLNNSTFSISRCLFQDLDVEGGISVSNINGSNATINIEHTIFKDNKSFRGGGALEMTNLNTSNTVNITSCEFTNNKNDNFGMGPFPVAIMNNSNGNLNIENSSFTCNTVVNGFQFGGSHNPQMMIKNSTFNNTCGSVNGFPTIWADTGNVKLEGSNVINE